MSTQGIQGHDIIPQAVAGSRLGKVITELLPGWSVSGEYNLDARPSTQLAALQLGKNLHSGPHPWLNDAIKAAVPTPMDFAATPPEKEV